VVRQELICEKGIVASLRTVERALQPYRQELLAEARATVRFETPPGKQLQIDFGERLVGIGGRKVKVFLFVATLGYSRRLHVRAFRHERQESWFDGLESAFLSIGGVPEEVLLRRRRHGRLPAFAGNGDRPVRRGDVDDAQPRQPKGLAQLRTSGVIG
jgi:transposase